VLGLTYDECKRIPMPAPYSDDLYNKAIPAEKRRGQKRYQLDVEHQPQSLSQLLKREEQVGEYPVISHYQ